MPHDAFIETYTDLHLKAQAEAVFTRLGINMSQAINMFFAQVALRSALPFDVSIPANDTEFFNAKEASFQAWKNHLSIALEESESAFVTGRYYTPEEAKARTQAKLLQAL